MRSVLVAAGLCLLLQAGGAQAPDQYFGFQIGADGELARYPKILEYLQLLSKHDRSRQVRGARQDDDGESVRAGDDQLAGEPGEVRPAGRDQPAAGRSARADARRRRRGWRRKGRRSTSSTRTIHSTEVGNTQALIKIVHRLATDNSPEIKQILDNVVVLIVPSQNPDGQVPGDRSLVQDEGHAVHARLSGPVSQVRRPRRQPRLVHVHAEGDAACRRDRAEQVQADHHARHAPAGRPAARASSCRRSTIRSIRTSIRSCAGDHARSARRWPRRWCRKARKGVAWDDALRHVGAGAAVHGLPRPAAHPHRDRQRAISPIRRQRRRHAARPAGVALEFPGAVPEEHLALGTAVEYGVTVAFAGMAARREVPHEWLENFYRVHADWVNRTERALRVRRPGRAARSVRDLRAARHPAVSAKSRSTRRRRRSRPAASTTPPGSWVIKTAQPYGAFAKTMLERQNYPDLRLFPGGPPEAAVRRHRPHAVDADGRRRRSDREAVRRAARAGEGAAPGAGGVPGRLGGHLPDRAPSNAAFIAVAQAAGGEDSDRAAQSTAPRLRAGTWIVHDVGRIRTDPRRGAARHRLEVTRVVLAVHRGRLSPEARDPHRPVARRDNMPAGWLKWVFEQYGFNHKAIVSSDFEKDLAAQYDTIVLPDGTSRNTIVNGLERRAERQGVGLGLRRRRRRLEEAGRWVKSGGTLVAIGSAVETARRAARPADRGVAARTARGWRPWRWRPRRPRGRGAGRQGPDPNRALRDAFSSPASLDAMLRDRVIDPTTLFYCPGSLLQNEFNTAHPVAWGMPAAWPVFFEGDQAYRLKPGFSDPERGRVAVSAQGPILQSGWLLGEESPQRPGQRRRVPRRQGLRRDHRQPGRLPRPAARDVQAALQRDVPRPVDQGPGWGPGPAVGRGAQPSGGRSAPKSLLRRPEKHASGDPSVAGQGPPALDEFRLATTPWPDFGACGVFFHLTPERPAPRDFSAKHPPDGLRARQNSRSLRARSVAAQRIRSNLLRTQTRLTSLQLAARRCNHEDAWRPETPDVRRRKHTNDMAKQSDSAPEFVKFVGPVLDALTAPRRLRAVPRKCGAPIAEGDEAFRRSNRRQPTSERRSVRDSNNQVHWARFSSRQGRSTSTRPSMACGRCTEKAARALGKASRPAQATRNLSWPSQQNSASLRLRQAVSGADRAGRAHD